MMEQQQRGRASSRSTRRDQSRESRPHRGTEGRERRRHRSQRRPRGGTDREVHPRRSSIPSDPAAPAGTVHASPPPEPTPVTPRAPGGQPITSKRRTAGGRPGRRVDRAVDGPAVYDALVGGSVVYRAFKRALLSDKAITNFLRLLEQAGTDAPYLDFSTMMTSGQGSSPTMQQLEELDVMHMKRYTSFRAVVLWTNWQSAVKAGAVFTARSARNVSE